MTMDSPLAPKRIGSIESISYYKHSQVFAGADLVAGTPLAMQFFQGSDGSAAYPNELGRYGQLPQSASGWLRQVMCTPFVHETDATGSRMALALKAAKELPWVIGIEVYVADILVARGPMSVYGAPGTIVQGLSDTLATSGGQHISNAMSGLPMMDHPIAARNSIRVQTKPIGQLPVGFRPLDAASGAKIGLHVCIGVAQATAIAGQDMA